MNKVEKIVSRIFEEQEFKTVSIPGFEFKDGLIAEIQVASKDDFNFFVCVFFDLESFEKINDSYQIELYSKLKESFINEFSAKDSPIQLNKSFDKNTTLIIATYADNNLTTRKLISSIEENAYYFKKQVLSISSDELEVCDLLVKANIITKLCEEEILSVDEFQSFSNGESPKYSLVSKLYEKLPFFALKVNASSADDLYNNIYNTLTDQQKSSVETYNNLNEANVSSWIDMIGVNND